MPKIDEFVEYACEQLAQICTNVTYKRMFGGYSLYENGQIFAMVCEGELYFKGHKSLNQFYEEKNSHPFTYDKNGKPYEMNYWLVPGEVLEDAAQLQEWFDVAFKAGKA